MLKKNVEVFGYKIGSKYIGKMEKLSYPILLPQILKVLETENKIVSL